MELITYINHPQQNSYVTLTEAENYLTTYKTLPSDSNWLNLTDEQKKYCLILGCNALEMLKFKGKKYVNEQRLSFPRFKLTRSATGSGLVTSFGLYDVQYNRFAEIPLDSFLIADNLNITIGNDSTLTFDIDVEVLNLNYLDIIYLDNVELNHNYLTIKTVSNNTITVVEPTVSENVTEAGLYLTKLKGIPENVKYAQIDLSYILIAETLFNQDSLRAISPMIRSIDLGGSFVVQYFRTLLRDNFNLSSASILDIVYYLLVDWISPVGGTIV